MFELRFTALFRRKYKKLIRRNKTVEKQIDETLERLMVNPGDVTLRSHKVAHRNRKAFSSRVTGDLRIIWSYSDSEVNGSEVKILDILDVGGHEGSRSVYR